MKLLKKISAVALAITLAVSSIFISNPKESYAATSCKKVLKKNVTYKYDLDGDGDLDTIRIYSGSENLNIKVNNCVKPLILGYVGNEECFDFSAKIYDFNKHDKSKEIVFEWAAPSDGEIRLLKFKNSTCKVNRTFQGNIGGRLKSYDSNTGIVTFAETSYGIYSKFEKAIGSVICYAKVKVNGYTLTNQTTANTDSYVRKNKYIAAKNLTAYTSVSGTKKAFTISKGSPAYIYALYQKGNIRYIKVKNKNGKYGYIKAGSTLLFKRNSCLWFQ
ncbi:hypothetical protein [Intestinibacter bartlettii]|uniref:hypothetical protein n=1 Tax=Intestinibacter bartlettii TaxID=261299 RepID=UPI0034A4675B